MRETQVVYRCDVCGADGAQTCDFRVNRGTPWRADLCDKHLRQVMTVMDYGTQQAKKPRAEKPVKVLRRKSTASRK